MAETADIQPLSEEQLAELALRCLILPLQGMTLMLPNTVVAEVTDMPTATPAAHSPDWLVGFISWRGRNIPLVSFERLLGQKASAHYGQHRMVVCNTLTKNPRLPFVAMVMQGLPHLSLVKHSMLTYDAEAKEKEAVVLAHMRLEGETVIVPNIDVIEKMLENLGVATR